MSSSDTILQSAGEAYAYLKTYLEQQIEYTKLDLAERFSVAISSALTTVIVSFLIIMALGFVSLALGFFLAERLGSYGQAFLYISGAYVLIALIATLFSRILITRPILSKMIKIFFE
jgi:hypothetical protein